MIPWIFTHSPLEHWLPDYQRTFDAWEDGGVRGIVFGYLQFMQDDGTTIRTFAPDPEVYKSFGVSPPPEAPRDLEKEKQLHAMLDDAASRDWHIMTFSVPGGGGTRPLEEDPYGAVGFAASVQDTMNAYPQAHGVIIDGPGEQHYELAFHHGGELLEIREHERHRFAALGKDLPRLERGIAHLGERLHNLTPSLVRYHAPGGMLAALTLFDINEDVLYWLRTRQETALGYMQAVRTQLDQLNRKVELGGIPRTATFSSLTGQNYQQMASLFDYIFPKHYFWHRGFDGMYGTIARWVQILSEWNPTLTEEDCFALVTSLFGIELPGVHSLIDMELGFPDEFFSEVVRSETQRALEAIGDDDKVVAWVSTGRSPHAGDAMTARDLHNILTTSERAGLKRFLFHPDPDLGAAEWRVISGLCGNLWQEDPSGYWPSDTQKPDEFSGGRKPPRSE
jgi:hypothetical protein